LNQELNFDDYQAGALATEKPKAEIRGDEFFVRELLTFFINAGKVADLLKKSIIYGKEITPEQFQGALRCAIHDASYAKGLTTTGEMLNTRLTINPRLLHATLGSFGECGEMFEALKSQMLGEGLDLVNVVEEAGDGLWFKALELDEVQMLTGMKPVEVAERNLAKLDNRKRNNGIGGNVENRDLAAERAILAGDAFERDLAGAAA
jgi:NTP pyrophosphatase (non-canonical NTP hydrolase)